MHTLDDARTYKTYDVEDIGFGIDRLAEQVRIAWHDAQEVALPKTYSKIKQILIVGMGGSTLAPHILQRFFEKKGKIPMVICNDYAVPSWVGADTLVIISSFSGTTEETLAAADDARKKKAKLAVVTTGGLLGEWVKKHHVPSYQFVPGDFAKQPRLGLGFSLAGILGLCKTAGLLTVKEEDIQRAMAAMSEVTDLCANDVRTEENPAKQVAEAMCGKQVLIVGAEHLAGNAHILANQINETSKQYASYFLLPELNHHLLEGFGFPKDFSENTTIIFLHSALYHPRTRKRFTITADMVEDMGVHVVDYVARGKDTLEEACEVLQFSSYVSWYLAMLNKVNPTAIPCVDAFKKKMGKV